MLSTLFLPDHNQPDSGEQPEPGSAVGHGQGAGGDHKRPTGPHPADGQQPGPGGGPTDPWQHNSHCTTHANTGSHRHDTQGAAGGETGRTGDSHSARDATDHPAVARQAGAAGRRQPNRSRHHGAAVGGSAAGHGDQVCHGAGDPDPAGAQDSAAGIAGGRLHAATAGCRTTAGQAAAA